MKQLKTKSPVGDLYLVASDKGLQGVFWEKQNFKNSLVDDLVDDLKATKILNETEKQLAEYFSGKRKSFNLDFDVDGTAFQKNVWKELSQIPYGKTFSYKQIAKKIKSDAVRAVGSANGKNPLCIIVPCHRVIAADGTLGGYSGGLAIKKTLLELESKFI